MYAMPRPTVSHSLGSALTALSGRQHEMIGLTRSWVETNSYNSNVEGVNRVGALLREAFTLSSLTLSVIPSEGAFGDHLVWRTAASGPPILLVGHHDTVFPPGHFEGWKEDGARAI